jgi:transposase
MGHIEGSDRDQMTLFPEALDDYVSQENPVRFIDAFAESLDMEELGFAHAVPNEVGRPPYNPADLLRLFIYGYLNRVQSSWTNGPLQPPAGKRSRSQRGTHVALAPAGPRLQDPS